MSATANEEGYVMANKIHVMPQPTSKYYATANTNMNVSAKEKLLDICDRLCIN